MAPSPRNPDTPDGTACPKEFGFHGDAPSVRNMSCSAGAVVAEGGTGDVEGASRREPGRELCNGGHGVKMSLLPFKKRALSDSGSRSSSSSGDSSFSPKKRWVDDWARAGSEHAGGCGTPVRRDHGPAAAEGAKAASPEPAAEVDALAEAERKRLCRRKWIATAESSSVAPQPSVKKFTQDGNRSAPRFNERFHHAPRDAHAAVTTTTKEDKQRNNTDARDGVVFGEALNRRLAQLGATDPSFVYRKRLEKSDVRPNQNRLLVSCKRESRLAECPITPCFSPAEMRRVEDKNVGLFVTALDRSGQRHTLTCKFLESNRGYRFISGWGNFLRRNGLVLDAKGRWTRDVDVELWLFRSRALPRQPKLDKHGKLVKGKDRKPVEGNEEAEHFHQDGALGLVLLHDEHRRGRDDIEG